MEQTQMILSSLFRIFCSFYMAAAINVFLHCFYDAGILWTRKKAVIIGILAIIEAIINFFWYDSLIAFILILIAYLVVSVYDYEGNKFLAMVWVARACLLSSLPMMFVSFIGMYFVIPGYSLYSSETSVAEDLIMNIFMMLFFGFIFHYLWRRLYRENIFIPCGIREKLFVAVYTIFSCILYGAILISGKESRATLMIITLFIFLFMAIFPIFVYYARISDYYRERTRYQETYLQAELAHFQQYKQAQEATRRFRHDIRNNLLCMNEMLRSGKTQDAEEYLQDMLNTVDALSVKYISGDEILDCILAAKAEVMAQKQIVFRLDGVLAGGLPWKPIDVCSVFANALDNAIEACESIPMEQRTITIKLKATSQFWFVRIENSVERNIDVTRLFQEKGGYTSKSNSGQHGIGTYNIKRTVESYGGILKAECKDMQFILEIIIDKSSTE